MTETIRVLHHHDSDGWWAESPDVEGWSAAGDSYAEVVGLAEEGIPFAVGREVELEHLRAGADPESGSPWLAAMIREGVVRPGNGSRHMPKPVKLRGADKTAAEYVTEGRR